MVDISHPLSYNLAALVAGLVLATGLIGTVSAAEYLVGPDPDDWWTVYPDHHPGAGSEVDHPSWVLELLEDGPILILDHSTNCEACIKQEEAANAVLEEVGEDAIAFENLIADPNNERANALFEIYDPNAGTWYIPLTVIITLVEDEEGNVVVGWHSGEGETGEDWLLSYVEDAIQYHEENVGDWDA
ncbi:hypothetical protein Mhar_1557 [Methanothrix harundinacea 6Ac]|uniref:Uncharacterized protein n=1 Tax=Methanothrix harundinacea (strain 6Ac) TaxID=1110509 RepID=G7WP77_METH6|nr:hypothetical protein Mhar_1557 [Methanothrix harundinacea 6Ac]